MTVTIRADLIGSDICAATGITATANAPVLALCRKLIEAGHDPATRLGAYRGATLALTVRSIGEVAQLDINSKGTGFVRRVEDVRTAPPARKSDPAVVGARTDWPPSTEAAP
jgi:hypothetical protein